MCEERTVAVEEGSPGNPGKGRLYQSRREMMVDSTRVVMQWWEKWSDSGHISKVEPTGFADGWDIAGEREE